MLTGAVKEGAVRALERRLLAARQARLVVLGRALGALRLHQRHGRGRVRRRGSGKLRGRCRYWILAMCGLH